MGLMGTATAPSVKLSRIGDSVSGTIVGEVVERQQSDYATKAPLFFDDGAPRTQFVCPLYVADEFGPDDNGKRTLYIKAGMVAAVRSAVREAGEADLSEGGCLFVEYVADDTPRNPGMKGQKRYRASYSPPGDRFQYTEPPL
jgi:hypothetical protein